MKILNLILDGYPTFRPDVAALWGKYLPRTGVYCDLSTIRTKAEVSPENWAAGECFLYEPPKNRIVEQFGAFFHDCKVLLRSPAARYDAIQVRDKSFICLPAMLIARMRGIPFFYWMSFPIAESLARLAETIDWRKNFARWLFLTVRGRLGGFLLRRFVLPHSDHIFVQSDRMLDDLANIGISRARMTAVPMCIDPDRFSEPLPPATAATGEPKRIIGYLGECSRVRRIDFLIEAAALVKREIPNIELLIVGDGLDEIDRDELRNCIKRFGLQDSARVTGWVSTDVALKEFSNVNIGLALVPPDPLLDCASPTKLVEYLAMGIPVVANHHPDQNFVIEKSRAGLSVPFDVRAYADAILVLLRDDETCNQMMAEGRRWVLKNRSYDSCARFLRDKYESLVRGVA